MVKRAIVLNDQHIPFDDKHIRDLTYRFIADFKPDIIDLLGDCCDFFQISKFSTDPERKTTLQEDIDKTHSYLIDLRSLAPEAEIELHAGNHVDRMRKFIWSMAKELDCIRSLDLRFLLGLENLKISFIECAEGYRQRGKLIMTHGTMVSQESAMTARRMLSKYGLSVIHGHAHRGGSTYKTDLLGTRGAWENFCLCRMDLAREWRQGFANWQQGFSTVTYIDDRFYVQQVPIIKGKFIYGDKLYE